MGYLDDVYSIMKTMASARDTIDKYQHKSIAKGALDGTMQFGLLGADSIQGDMLSTAARMFERTYASFVQTYLSSNNTINIALDKNPNMFLRRFHQNIKLEATSEDIYYENCVEHDPEYEELMERVYNGTTKAYVNTKENRMLVFNFSDKLNRSIYESNQTLLEESLSAIDFYPFPNIGNSPFFEDEKEDLHDLMMHGAKKSIDSQYGRADSKVKDSFTLQNNDKLRVPAMTDTDVKKSNDLQPYTMQVRLMAINDENEFVQFMDFIIGVKVVLHPIKSQEMIINLQNALQNNGKLFNFIRWTTGEKSLIKDLLLHVNDVKLDVANKSKGSSPWWMTLKRMRETSKAQAAFMSRTQFVPQATIVISSYEVDAIQKNIGMNLKDPKVAEKIMKTLFLMNFAIIDEGTRTVDVLYDGQTSYQTYALETLEREVSMNSNKIGKELTRMISR